MMCESSWIPGLRKNICHKLFGSIIKIHFGLTKNGFDFLLYDLISLISNCGLLSRNSLKDLYSPIPFISKLFNFQSSKQRIAGCLNRGPIKSKTALDEL